MAHKSIDLNNISYTFQDRYTLGVSGRITAFNRLPDATATDEYESGRFALLRTCYAFTVNITGASDLALFWAVYGAQRPSEFWAAALDNLTDADLLGWYAAYQAIQDKPTDADFLADGKPSTD